MIDAKSFGLEQALLAHLFLGVEYPCPREWWLTLHSSPETVSLTGSNELAEFPPLAPARRVYGWTLTAADLDAREGAKVTNRYDLVLPSPPEGQEWLVTHYGLWADPDLSDLLYWKVLQTPFRLFYGQTAILAAGQLVIREN